MLASSVATEDAGMWDESPRLRIEHHVCQAVRGAVGCEPGPDRENGVSE
jgi:hypothetical protein